MDKQIIDGTRDLTEKDMAMLKYYQLANEQAWWNLQRRIAENKQKQNRMAKKWAFNILIVVAIAVLLLIITNGN